MDKQAYKDKIDKIKAQVSGLTEEQIEAHAAKVAAIYSKRSTPSRLGVFEDDPDNVYYWNTYDDDPHKLAQRLEVGWGLATREDAIKGGLTEAFISDATIDGETCVEMSHKNCRAVLLKMPRELHEINSRIKERLKQNRPVFDSTGKPITTEVVSSTSEKLVQKRIENTTTFN